MKRLMIIALTSMLVFANSCQEEERMIPAELSTTPVTQVTHTRAGSGGTIISEGNSSVTDRGICWGTNDNPTILDNFISDGSGKGTFVTNISNLIPNTTYYIRAYATNKAGTSYGNIFSFVTKALELPILTTTNLTNTTLTTSTAGGNIFSDGGSIITVRGTCWSTSPNPTIAQDKTTDGNGIGIFTSNLSSLNASTTYYVRAYATNSVGTGYGNMVAFTTSIVDVEGKVYKTVHIGSQIWMAENLKTTKYRNGDLIATTVSPTIDIRAETTPKYQWGYNGLESNVTDYGRLYTWFTVADSRYVSPIGWHIPSKDEWNTLSDYLGGSNFAGKKLKEAGTVHWLTNNGATNEIGFTALPGGSRKPDGEFRNFGVSTAWWTSTPYVDFANDYESWSRNIIANDDILYLNASDRKVAYSVRCVKD